MHGSPTAPARTTGKVQVVLDARSRYTYKVFVRPAYRGQRIARRLHDCTELSELVRERSVALMLIDLDNHASLRSAAASGFRAIGTVGFIGWRERFFGFRTGGARRAGVALVAARRPGVPIGVIAPESQF
jgi:hypothetical protein